MKIENQVDAYVRPMLNPIESKVEGGNVVDDFRDILPRGARLRASFILKQVYERRLRPFNLARKDGFLPDVHVDEEVGIGQGRGDGVEPGKTPFCLGQSRYVLIGVPYRWIWRQCPRTERSDSFAELNVLPHAPGLARHLTLARAFIVQLQLKLLGQQY